METKTFDSSFDVGSLRKPEEREITRLVADKRFQKPSAYKHMG